MFSYKYYFYLYFICFCMYLHVAALNAEDDKFSAFSGSFDYRKNITSFRTKISKWKVAEKVVTNPQVNPPIQGKTSGNNNMQEAKSNNLLHIRKDFIEAITKVIGKRDRRRENVAFTTLSAFRTNSLADFFKNLSETANNVTSDINVDTNINITLDYKNRSFEKQIDLKQNEINLDPVGKHNVVADDTTDGDLTAEDRYPNYVTNPHLVELDPFKFSGNNPVLPKTKDHSNMDTIDGSEANVHESITGHLEIPDDKFTTVKGHQKIISDPTMPNVTLELAVFGEIFKALLVVLNGATFTPNANLTVHSKENMKNISIATLEELHMYEGALDSQNKSYICGSIVDGYFTGVVMFENGTVWYVERSENSNNTENSTSGEVTDVSFQNCIYTNNSCHEKMPSSCKHDAENKTACLVSDQDRKEKGNSIAQVSLSNNTRSNNSSFDILKNVSCPIVLVSDHSHFVVAHNRSILPALRELLTVILPANRMLNEVDLDGDGKPENMRLRIEHVAMYSYKDYIDKGNSTMDQTMDIFLKTPQRSCLSLLLLRKDLPDEEPISITYGGNNCQGITKEIRPPTNVAVINVMGPKNRSRSLLPMGRRVTETIGEMMGSWERDCKSQSTNFSGNKLMSYFSDCARKSKHHLLGLHVPCLKTHQDSQVTRMEVGKPCGNGVVDSGEECDCGKNCQNYSCCVPSGTENECQYDKSKGYECDWTAPCCTMSCKIVPKDWRKFCGMGDPSCGHENAYCDGNSSACPALHHDLNASNGHRCGPGNLEQLGAATCKNGRCDSTVCRDAGLEDCRCESDIKSQKRCKVCCKKNQKGEQCLPAEHFGLKSSTSNFFFRSVGLPCSTVYNEFCDNMGACTSRFSGSGQANIFYSTLVAKGTSAAALIAWTVVWRVMCFRYV